MSAAHAAESAQTYIPPAPEERARILDLVRALEARGRSVMPQPALIEADGTRHPLTPQLADALARVAKALANGQGITVAPRQMMLTTQEAAELLGVSRPTLVKILERGELAFTMRGRHRRVMLSDLLGFQETLRKQRSAALRDMQQASEDAGLYDLLDHEPDGDD